MAHASDTNAGPIFVTKDQIHSKIFSCRWSWCRHTFNTNSELNRHVLEEHVQLAVPVRRRDIPLLQRAEEGIGDSLTLSLQSYFRPTPQPSELVQKGHEVGPSSSLPSPPESRHRSISLFLHGNSELNVSSSRHSTSPEHNAHDSPMLSGHQDENRFSSQLMGSVFPKFHADIPSSPTLLRTFLARTPSLGQLSSPIQSPYNDITVESFPELEDIVDQEFVNTIKGHDHPAVISQTSFASQSSVEAHLTQYIRDEDEDMDCEPADAPNVATSPTDPSSKREAMDCEALDLPNPPTLSTNPSNAPISPTNPFNAATSSNQPSSESEREAMDCEPLDPPNPPTLSANPPDSPSDAPTSPTNPPNAPTSPTNPPNAPTSTTNSPNAPISSTNLPAATGPSSKMDCEPLDPPNPPTSSSNPPNAPTSSSNPLTPSINSLNVPTSSTNPPDASTSSFSPPRKREAGSPVPTFSREESTLASATTSSKPIQITPARQSWYSAIPRQKKTYGRKAQVEPQNEQPSPSTPKLRNRTSAREAEKERGHRFRSGVLDTPIAVDDYFQAGEELEPELSTVSLGSSPAGSDDDFFPMQTQARYQSQSQSQ